MEKLKFGSEYLASKKQYPFPSEDISQQQKNDPGYFLGCCNAIVSKFVNNRCAIPYDTREGWRSFSELRAYRGGYNNPNKYKNYLCGLPDKVTGNRKSTLNISWEVLKILAQKMDVVKGYMQKISYDVVTSANDYESLIAKKTLVSMAKVLADPNTMAMQQQINETAGQQVLKPQDPTQQPGGMQFDSPQDVDIASQMGLFYLEHEAALQNLLIKTRKESKMDGVIDLWNEDLMTCGYAGSFISTNQNTSMVTGDYIDVDKAVWPYSIYDDYRDISWGGFYRPITIAQLRKESDIPEEELVKIARRYSSDNYGNTAVGFYKEAADGRQYGNFGMNMMDQIIVDVFECRWFGQKNVNMTSIVREKEKTTSLNLVDDNYQLKDKDKNKGKELYKYTNQTIYKAKIVLGTSCVFDYGEDNDISYKKDVNGNKWPIFPMRFSRCLSLVDRCVGFVDDANLANLKLRVARRKMPAPPNMQIDKSALEGMQINGVKYKPKELMQLLQDEGFLITDSKNQWGNNTSQGAAIRPIPTDIINQLAAWWEDMGRSIEMIEKVTGINDVFSAQTPQRQTGLGVSNLLVAGTQNALTPLVKAREYLEEATYQCASQKWQIVATYMPDEQRKRLSINRSLEITKVSSDLIDYDFDTEISLSYSDQEVQQLMADLQNMKSAARAGGQVSMNESDFLIVGAMLKNGNIIQAQLYTAHAVEKRQKEAKEEQMQAIQANGQQQQQSLQQKQQGDAQMNQIDAQTQSQLQAQKSAADTRGQIQLEMVKASNARQQAILEAQLGENKKSA